MSKILENLHRTLAAGVVLAVVVFLIVNLQTFDGAAYWPTLVKWIHVWFGILWIGLLYYFNFVQIPSMPKIPDEQKPAVSKVIAPNALFWFRWGAMATIVTGLLLAWMNGYIGQAISLQKPFAAIGVGMWLAAIMWFNVWFIIWPNQKKVLGIVTVGAEEKAAAAKKAGFASRLNTMLSIPMLFCMVAQQNGGF